MNNKKIAEVLYEIAEILEMKNVKFKPWAYRKAAQTIESLNEDVKDILKEGKLEELPGIGESIAKKIRELIETGKSRYYEKLKKGIPVKLAELEKVEGLGPKRIKLLYDKLNIKDLKQLKKATKKGKIRKIKSLGEKVEKNILEGAEFVKKSGKRFLLGMILGEAEEIKELLRKRKEITKIELAGSLRRMKETIGDLDILAVSKDNKKTMDFFCGMSTVQRVLAKGNTKSSVRLKNDVHVDLRLVNENEFGSALQYFTGSKQHSIELRKIAIGKKMKLSEYGLFKGKKKIAGESEINVYGKLGLQYIEPELRENIGEIEAAKKKKLPKLVKYGDVKGDLHMHTNWSDGGNTIKEMVEQTKRLGNKFIAITDHAGDLKIAGALSDKQILKQMKEVNKISDGVKVFYGLEVNIKKNGDLDVGDSILKKVDVVIASIHSGFRQSRDLLTKRILKAMDNKYVKIIAHPTGRILLGRRGYELNFNKIFKKAMDNGVALEVNAFPARLDLDYLNVKNAVENKVKISIGTDAHNIDQLKFLKLGTSVARKGWAEKKDIINCFSIGKLTKFFER